jgi:hypothetical protein
MLMETAMGLQQQPKLPDRPGSAVELCHAALMAVLRANPYCPRIAARKETTLQAIPERETASLERPRKTFDARLDDPVFPWQALRYAPATKRLWNYRSGRRTDRGGRNPRAALGRSAR